MRCFSLYLGHVFLHPSSIRYAAPPTGSQRWQPPRLPSSNDTATGDAAPVPVTAATEFGPICPQNYPAVPGLPFIPGDEDCLFLNVYAPADAKDLPVLVYIHGGGYGYGDGRIDMSEIIGANGGGFVAVVIQYRVCILPKLLIFRLFLGGGHLSVLLPGFGAGRERDLLRNSMLTMYSSARWASFPLRTSKLVGS